MYKLPYFTEEDNEKVIAFMKKYSFATIVANNDTFPVATHIPLDISEHDGKLFFTGHIMKNTDHHHAFADNENVLVIFNGPHCYVSASWYSNPAVASTWNYMTVHTKGKINFADENRTRDIIREITDKYEGKDSTASFDKLPEEYVNRLVKAIVGFTIEVESFENVFKLSQNHPEETRKSIIGHLLAADDDNSKAIAKYMQLVNKKTTDIDS